jgi:hypothetical protein
MKRSCGEFCHWTIGDNYVSFVVGTQDSHILVKNIRLHTITETLLDMCPDYRYTNPVDQRTTSRVIQAILDKCQGSSQYAAANIELAHNEKLLNQV